jgi:hypothetical protein
MDSSFSFLFLLKKIDSSSSLILKDSLIDKKQILFYFRAQFEVFLHDYGVLSSKLQAYEELGLSQSSIVTFIVSSPYLWIMIL